MEVREWEKMVRENEGMSLSVDSLFIAKEKHGKGSIEYKRTLTKLQQPYAAKIAINEGGLLKKGFGGSTQKYVVPVKIGRASCRERV